ncbi:RnfABCDGE type electron transport complex subunit G [Robertkochia sediminum]|uniref:RnfABCDGE type electron transport complex subunit G n=1 Tax=Robertkochia sediminum TaxID=2785326 RepID=UPI0019348432|nr:RnfABCDGE type electron transport complex subunit G [Robertkochia sediminum]MBL7472200.1 RnfABCDGE type electron transport complex subunit G [Robertkochia sediminum]
MSETTTIKTQKPASSNKMLFAMGGIGIISALLIVMTFELTKPRIEQLKAEALEKAIFEVLPGTVRTQAMAITPEQTLAAPKAGDASETLVYAGFDANEALVGYAVEAAGQGYADIIRILYGYDPASETIIGFRVLESKETPGLGDKIEKEQRFLDNFKALDVSLDEQGAIRNTVITVKQGEKVNAWEVDGISGATISSRAIGDIIGRSSKEIVPVLHGANEQEVTSQDDKQ